MSKGIRLSIASALVLFACTIAIMVNVIGVETGLSYGPGARIIDIIPTWAIAILFAIGACGLFIGLLMEFIRGW